MITDTLLWDQHQGGPHERVHTGHRTDDEAAVDSLRENDRRRYAAIEATKLGHGGVEFIARVLGCDPKTIGQGQTELEEGDDLDTGRVRKKGVAANG